VLITAAEISLSLAEYYLNAGNDGAAKTAYEKGIKESVEFYYWIRSISNDNTAIALVPTTAAEIQDYIDMPAVSWDAAATEAAKLKLLATQKWIHFNVVQPLENWAELRRLDALALSFEVDNSNAQKQPPYRWLYAASEQTYNTENYQEVAAKDNLTTKIFWDVN
jgi:hypothetical protein